MSGTSVAKWRALYVKYNPMNANKPASIADIAFDTGVIAERQRIIKLLKETDSVSAEWAITLIKGKDNEPSTKSKTKRN
jgi:hypothetical protein